MRARLADARRPCTAPVRLAVAEQLCLSPRALPISHGGHPQTALAAVLTPSVAPVELSLQASIWWYEAAVHWSVAAGNKLTRPSGARSLSSSVWRSCAPGADCAPQRLQMGKHRLSVYRKGKDGQRPEQRTGAATTKSSSDGGNAATRKPRKVAATKASAGAAVASAPLYSKFAASQRLDAAAARAARLAQRRGMPEAAASASGDGMVTPPACSRAGSLTEHDSPAMSTASPNGMCAALRHDQSVGQRRSSTALRPSSMERPQMVGHHRARLHLVQHAACGISMLALLSIKPTRRDRCRASPSIAGGGGVRLPGGCPSGSVPYGT